MITEADTCRKYVLPNLIQAGWDNDPHSFTEQKTFTDGRIVVAGNDERWKIENGEANKGREMYFAIYQAIAKDERRPGLYKEYARDFAVCGLE